MSIQYDKTVMYKIVCNDLNIIDAYVGSTTHFINRKSKHKNCCCNSNSSKHNLKLYQFIRENKGWDNFAMVEIEKYPCNDGNEARARERYWYETLNSQLNMINPYREKNEWNKLNKEKKAATDKQYYELNKEKIAEYQQEYKELHKEKIAETKKKYRELNIEKLAESSKEYRENNKEKRAAYNELNKEKIAEQCKQYRKLNKEKLAEKRKQLRENKKQQNL